jgi:hypothetical protein
MVDDPPLAWPDPEMCDDHACRAARGKFPMIFMVGVFSRRVGNFRIPMIPPCGGGIKSIIPKGFDQFSGDHQLHLRRIPITGNHHMTRPERAIKLSGFLTVSERLTITWESSFA